MRKKTPTLSLKKAIKKKQTQESFRLGSEFRKFLLAVSFLSLFLEEK